MFRCIAMVYLTSDTFSVNQQCQTRVWLNEMTLKIVGEWLDTPTTFWPLWLHVTSKQLAIADCKFCSSVGIPPPVACRVLSSTVSTNQLPLVRHPLTFQFPCCLRHSYHQFEKQPIVLTIVWTLKEFCWVPLSSVSTDIIHSWYLRFYLGVKDV